MGGRLAGLILAVLAFGDPALRQPDGSRPASLSLTNKGNATDVGDSLSDRSLTVSLVAGNTEI